MRPQQFAAAQALFLPCVLLVSALVSLQGSVVIQQEDVSISYLPLAHMFERMIQVADSLCLRDVCLLDKLSVKVHLCDRSPCFVTGPKWDFIRVIFLSSWMTSKPSNRRSFLLCLVYSIAFMTRSVTLANH